jgi:deazaflavin-dependent oxidoreductase (nitroreductase family)
VASFAHTLAAHVDDECAMLTTRGRTSGNDHRIEIWFGVMGDTIYFISGNGAAADWYRNAMAHPDVKIELGRDVIEGIAAPVTDPDERHALGDLMAAKYPWDGDASIGLSRESWCYDVPALAVRRKG